MDGVGNKLCGWQFLRITEMGNVAEDWQMAMIRFIIGFGDRLDGHF